MTKYVPVPPRRITEVKTVYVAVNLNDSEDRFAIEAGSEDSAKAQLIYKLGYIITRLSDDVYLLVDDENRDRKLRLISTTLHEAYDEVLKAARWEVSEPTTLVGGKDEDD